MTGIPDALEPLEINMTKLFVMALIIFAVIELITFGVGWYYADEVECNFLYCKFINEDSTTTITTNQNCELNGEQINCSDIDKLTGINLTNILESIE